jgi:hypothetical protein
VGIFAKHKAEGMTHELWLPTGHGSLIDTLLGGSVRMVLLAMKYARRGARYGDQGKCFSNILFMPCSILCSLKGGSMFRRIGMVVFAVIAGPVLG